MTRSMTTLSCLAIAVFLTAVTGTCAQDNWPQFRGKQAAGVGSGNLPTEWDVESGKNILWKTETKGLAHSSPIVFGNQVILTTAINSDNEKLDAPTGFMRGTGDAAEDTGTWKWQVVSYDLDTGKESWRKTINEGQPKIKRHLKATHANCTPATDGKHIVAFFGSEGLVCLDMKGKILWKKDLGKLHSGPYNSPKLEWGFASSPVIHKDKVIVQCDCLNTRFVAAYDLADGKESLRIERNDVATWSTPTILETETETQIICNGYKEMASYDLATGEQLWKLGGGGDVPVPTPLIAHGMIFISNAHARNPLYAISPTARGDLTPDRENEETPLPKGLVWWQPRGGSYIPTPIIVGDYLYVCSDRGVLSVREAKTGERIYAKRIGKHAGTYSASAVATKDHLYFPNENGVISVVKTGPEYELVATNELNEATLATPAIAGDRLLIRTAGQLICIGKTD